MLEMLKDAPLSRGHRSRPHHPLGIRLVRFELRALGAGPKDQSRRPVRLLRERITPPLSQWVFWADDNEFDVFTIAELDQPIEFFARNGHIDGPGELSDAGIGHVRRKERPEPIRTGEPTGQGMLAGSRADEQDIDRFGDFHAR